MESGTYSIENVKSHYIIQFIFSYIPKIKELDIVKLNKNLKEKLEVNIDDYKKESRRYKIIGNDGIEKVYLIEKDILIFEGKYLNGKKNGTGIEYYEENKIKFIGEYLKGKKIKGEGYSPKGKLIYKIDNGKIEEYFINGKIKFKGEYLEGKKWDGEGYDFNGNELYKRKWKRLGKRI